MFDLRCCKIKQEEALGPAPVQENERELGFPSGFVGMTRTTIMQFHRATT